MIKLEQRNAIGMCKRKNKNASKEGFLVFLNLPIVYFNCYRHALKGVSIMYIPWKYSMFCSLLWWPATIPAPNTQCFCLSSFIIRIYWIRNALCSVCFQHNELPVAPLALSPGTVPCAYPDCSALTRTLLHLQGKMTRNTIRPIGWLLRPKTNASAINPCCRLIS